MIFITGTGTGVGKTVTGRAILAALRERGVRAAPFKPVETGCLAGPDGSLVPEDAMALLAAAGLRADVDVPLERVCPCRFPDPVSPHLAAERVGSFIDPETILAAFRALKKTFGFISAESAGGLLVPLRPGFLMIDLVKRLKLPVLLVSRDELGAINHTLLSIEALRRRRIPDLGVVFVRTPSGPAGDDPWGNARAVSEHGETRVLATIPWLDPLDDAALARHGAPIAQALLVSLHSG